MVQELQIYSSWDPEKMGNKYTPSFFENMMRLQSVARSICLFEYAVRESEHSALISPANALVSVKLEPKKFMALVSTNISEITKDWIVELLSKPRELADAVHNFFREEKSELKLFSMVTFPALFHHFITMEFQKAGLVFIQRMIRSHDRKFFEPFLVSFMDSSRLFSSSFWRCFEDFGQGSVGSLSLGDVFVLVIKALKVAINCLSSYQQEAINLYISKDKDDFNSFFCAFLQETMGLFLPNLEAVAIQRREMVARILNYMSSTPKCPQAAFVRRLFTSSRHKAWVPHHALSQFENNTPIVLSAHEFFLVQCIVKNNPQLVSVKFVQSFALRESLRSSLDPVFVTVATPSLFELETPERVFVCLEDGRYRELPFDKRGHRKSKIAWAQLKHLGVDPASFVLDKDAQIQSVRDKLTVNLSGKVENYLALRTHRRFLKLANSLESFLSQMSNNEYYSDCISKRRFIFQRIEFLFAMNLTGGGLVSVPSFHNQERVPLRSMVVEMKRDFFSPQTGVVTDPELDGRSPVRKIATTQQNFIDMLRKGEHRSEMFRRQSITERVKVPRTEEDEVIMPRPQMPRKRRKSTSAGQKELSDIVFKNSLRAVLNNGPAYLELKFWIFLVKMDNCELEDRTLNELSKRMSEHMGCLRFEVIRQKKVWKDMNKMAILAKKLNYLRDLRKGSALLAMLEFGDALRTLCMEIPCHSSKRNEVFAKTFERCWLLADNDSFYDCFVWYEKMLGSFPELGTMFSSKDMVVIDFLQKIFWQFLNNVSPELCTKTKECRRYLFQM